tara:strand:+ start:137 stop:292 length:156 start_codon:yes stop_codon:yes gene_type:complete
MMSSSLTASEWTMLGVLENTTILDEEEKQMPVEEWIEYKVKQLKEKQNESR